MTPGVWRHQSEGIRTPDGLGPLCGTQSGVNFGMLRIAAMQIFIGLLMCVSFGAFAGNGGRTVFCIDPGHPSESGRGTAGKHLSEIDAAWDVALLLKRDLESDGYTVVMTKDHAEQFVTNEQRADIANSAGAALMIRLHCDADAGTGLACYSPDRQGTVHGIFGPSKDVIAASQRALHLFHPAVMKSLDGLLVDRGMHPDTSTRIGGIQGALTGSIFSQVPVVLVEMCVLTNPHDEAIISSLSGQIKIASALTKGAEAVVSLKRRRRFTRLFDIQRRDRSWSRSIT
jgi:N-acetylmuramoyl-L-alanine amidase